MDCEACERVKRYMAADPEMYRGEEGLCSAHQRIRELEEEVKRLKEEKKE